MAQQSGKGNPASRRMSNPRVKERRAASWRRGEARKEARKVAQAAREKANKEALSLGQYTPWGLAKLARKVKRLENRKEVA